MVLDLRYTATPEMIIARITPDNKKIGDEPNFLSSKRPPSAHTTRGMAIKYPSSPASASALQVLSLLPADLIAPSPLY